MLKLPRYTAETNLDPSRKLPPSSRVAHETLRWPSGTFANAAPHPPFSGIILAQLSLGALIWSAPFFMANCRLMVASEEHAQAHKIFWLACGKELVHPHWKLRRLHDDSLTDHLCSGQRAFGATRQLLSFHSESMSIMPVLSRQGKPFVPRMAYRTRR